MDFLGAATPCRTEGELVAGRYRITNLLGQGGMGVVHAATDVLSGQRLAIKRTLPDASSTTVELFKREFHTLHSLRHPHIVEVYDCGRDGERWFYSMELLEGSDLGKAAPLPWRQVCSYLRQIAALLGMLHARGLLHRDVSPRNIWILPDGRLKLIDFGALSAFGVPTEVVGTPALIAPEWLIERSACVHVDQRADLYALGALGYWLLTGVHARDALSMSDVVRSTAQPRPPSSVLAHAGIPSELDSLILALLRHAPAARPQNAEQVIDRIDAVAGPPSEPADHAAYSHIRSKAFVGRRFELQYIEQALRDEAAAARAIVVQAAPGLGRSRFLEELAVLGSLAGGVSVLVRPTEPGRAYGLANSLVLRLLDRMPEQALAAARKSAPVIGQLSREVQARLELSSQDLAPSRRSELPQVLTDWMGTLAAQRKLLILVDDIEDSDAETVAWLGLLARMCTLRGIVLVVALRDDPSSPSVLPLQLVFQAAERLQLAPLNAAEVERLLHSVFGPAEYLGRTAQAVYAATQGNPAHCLELLEYLVERRIARYKHGGWTLPGVLSGSELPDRRSAMQLTRFDQLSAPARRLAELLSIADARLARDDCSAVSELSESETSAALVELVVRGVLAQNQQGYAFLHASVREHAFAALRGERRTRAHARLGASLLRSADDPLDAMRAGLHLFRAGDHARGQQLTAAAVSYILNERTERLQSAVPLMEAAVKLFRAAGSRDEVIAGPLAVLASASGYVDHRLAARYGTEVLATLERVLNLERARRLRPYIGGKPALLAALASASLARGKAVRDYLQMFVRAAAVLNAVATATADVATSARCLQAMEPFAALGPDFAPGFVCLRMQATAAVASEAYSTALAGLRDFANLAWSDRRIRGLSARVRRDMATNALFPVGIMECWRVNRAALELAERMEAHGPLAAMNADHLRMVYHALRGERATAAKYRQRFEARAMEAGAPWQVVTQVPLAAQFTALWTHDALLGKRAAAELERISQQIPTLRHEARHAQATYLILCGRYHEVIELMRRSDSPRDLIGWSRGQGILARAHNRLGEHARARALCEAALAGRSDDDLTFVVLNLHVQLELALAEAAMGELDCSRERVKRLLSQHADRGPLALGAIHETRARVALLEREYAVARLHCTAMRHAYAPSQSPTLFELTDQLSDEIALAECADGRQGQRSVSLRGDDTQPFTHVHLFATQSDRRSEARVRRGLRVALELTGAQSGFMIAPAAAGETLYAEERDPDPEVLEWAKALRLVRADRGDMSSSERERGCSEELRRNGMCYYMFPLGPLVDPADPPPIVVLGFLESRTRPDDRRVLAIVTGALQETVA